MTTTMNKTTEQPKIYQTMADQIGNRAFQMWGTGFCVGDGRKLTFDVRGVEGRRINRVSVTLELNDTYTVEFYKVRGVHIEMVATREGVYADNLHEVIKAVTGLDYKL